MDVSEVHANCERLLDAVGETVVADRSFLETVLLGFGMSGHVLLEDVPGTGKTLTARTFADALDLSFSRIQFTPDLLPADVTGTQVFDEGTGEFRFEEGPIFASVVLADEINRAPPKTQSALLEAMEEEQVTVGSETRNLPDPFFVIATQNPVEMEGTWELPEAQRDRFAAKTRLGYPGYEGERELLRRRENRTGRTPRTEQVLTAEETATVQAVPETVRVDDDLHDYVVRLARRTREDPRVRLGVSPRGTERLFEAARTRAVLTGREYVTPDHVAAVAQPVLAHRLVLTPDARVEDVDPARIVADVLGAVEVPTVE